MKSAFPIRKLHTHFREALRRTGSAGFETCCIADFKVGRLSAKFRAWRVWKPAIQQTWKSALQQHLVPGRGISGLILIGLAGVAGVLLAAEPKVIFEDRFNGRLAEGWSWLREDPKTWRFKEDALEIRVEPGVAQTVKNALVRKAPDRSQRKFALEVTVTFTSPPSNQYEQAGLTWHAGGKPVFKLVHELIDGKTYIIPGKKPTETKTVRLRLVVSADKYEAQFRPDGQGEFQTAATGDLPPGKDEQISLQCYNGPPDAGHWMRFDDFRILPLTE